jgi:hypothetical protein
MILDASIERRVDRHPPCLMHEKPTRLDCDISIYVHDRPVVQPPVRSEAVAEDAMKGVVVEAKAHAAVVVGVVLPESRMRESATEDRGVGVALARVVLRK